MALGVRKNSWSLGRGKMGSLEGACRAALMDLQPCFLSGTGLTGGCAGRRQEGRPPAIGSSSTVQYRSETAKRGPSSPFARCKLNAAFPVSHKDIKKQISLETSISRNPNEAPGKR